MTRKPLFAAVVLAALLGPAAGPLGAQAELPWQGRAAVAMQVTNRSGEPVPGAEVALQYAGVQPPQGPAAVTTDGEGRVALGGLAEGEWRMAVSHPDYMVYTATIELRADKAAKSKFAAQVSTMTARAPLKVEFTKSRGAVPARPAPQQTARRVEPPAQPPSAPAPAPRPAPATPPPAAAAPTPSAPPAAATPPAPSTTPPAQPAPERPAPAAPPAAAAPAPSPAPVTPPPAQPAPVTQAPPQQVPAPATPRQVPTPQPAPPPAAPPVAAPPVERPAPPVPAPQAPPPPAATAPAPLPIPRSNVQTAGTGGCPECRTGERAVSVEQVAAPAGGAGSAGCPPDLAAKVRDAVRGLTPTTAAASYAGGLTDAGADGMAALFGPAGSAALADALGRWVGAGTACQVLAVVLPPGGRFVGYRYEAWDGNGGGDCLAGQDCPAGRARFADHAVVEKAGGASVVWAIFENQASDRQRHARLTAYFKQGR